MADKSVNIVIRANGSQAQSELSNVESALKKIAPLAGAAFGSAALLSFANDLYDVNSEYQKLSASLKTVTGSSIAADNAMKGLREFASSTPFELTEVTNGFIKLKARGLDPSIDSLTSYGNTASAMGKSLDQMIEAVGDAATGEFERLKEFGITARAEGDKVKFTFQGITTTVGRNVQEISGYLTNLGNTKFAGAMTEQMNTLGGATSNLKDTYASLLTTIGNSGLNTIAINAIKDLEEAFKRLADLFEDTPEKAMRPLVSELENLVSILPGREKAWAEAADWQRWFLPDPGPIKARIAELQQAIAEIAAPTIGPNLPPGGRPKSTATVIVAPITNPKNYTPDPYLDQTEPDAYASAQESLGIMRDVAVQELEIVQMLSDEKLRIKANADAVDAQITADAIARKYQELQTEQSLANSRLSLTGNFLTALTTLTGGKNKELFILQKAFAIGSAVMSAFQASALALATPPGPPATIPMSNLAFKLGMYNAAGIAAVNLASVAVGRGGGGSVGVGASYGMGTQTPIGDTTRNTTPQSNVTVVIQGNIIGEDEYVETRLVPAIERITRRNVTIRG